MDNTDDDEERDWEAYLARGEVIRATISDAEMAVYSKWADTQPKHPSKLKAEELDADWEARLRADGVEEAGIKWLLARERAKRSSAKLRQQKSRERKKFRDTQRKNGKYLSDLCAIVGVDRFSAFMGRKKDDPDLAKFENRPAEFSALVKLFQNPQWRQQAWMIWDQLIDGTLAREDWPGRTLKRLRASEPATAKEDIAKELRRIERELARLAYRAQAVGIEVFAGSIDTAGTAVWIARERLAGRDPLGSSTEEAQHFNGAGGGAVE